MAPADVAGLGLEAAGDGAEEGGLALAVVAEHGDVLAALDLDVDAAGHGLLGVADAEVAEAQGGAFARFHRRHDDVDAAQRLVDLDGLQAPSIFTFDAAWVAFEALARFLSMKVCNCLRRISTLALVASAWARCSSL